MMPKDAERVIHLHPVMILGAILETHHPKATAAGKERIAKEERMMVRVRKAESGKDLQSGKPTGC